MGKLVGKYQRDEINIFFDEKVSPALDEFYCKLPEIVGETSAHWQWMTNIILQYRENKLDRNDRYYVRQSGVRVSANEWLSYFYYCIYGTTAPYLPYDDYTVLIKSGGTIRFISDLGCVRSGGFSEM